MASDDLLDSLIEKIAEAVVRKIEEREKIDLIAQAVIARLEEQRGKEAGHSPEEGEVKSAEVQPSIRAARSRKGQGATVHRSNRQTGRKKGE
ncbi:MAG: hypothetical protein NZT92_04095 [Abditibacteriales bacterium]|nr:hypothetical protein [Abditibacteriales bacterium]MDW8365114.1 hypothetical protein [Abditibacteriales bacterium]